MSKPAPTDHRWNSDRAGRLPKDDELDRKEFAKRVAKELSGWRQKDSLVVSLNGDWGSGKSTLANLIRYYAEEQAGEAKQPKPIFISFNPWQWSGQDLVLQAFFDEVGAAFREDNFTNKELADRLAKFWGVLKVATVATGELATRLQESLTAITAIFAGASGLAAGLATNEQAKSILGFVSLGLLGLTALCGIYAPVSGYFADLFKLGSKKPKQTLEAVRKSLKEELEKLPAPVVVVIDDIDRLTKKEVRLLVQLVKANADFPNLVYVLLYQKSIVAAALAKITSESGQDFLKKIVQVELEVPAAPEQEMRKFFTKQITPVLERAEIRWDNERWTQLFGDVIWPWFRTPRDIKRFKGMFDFYFEAHVTDGILEVNPIDLILLEILRMFDPPAYDDVSRAFQKQRNLFLEGLFDDKEAQKRFNVGVEKLVTRPELDADARRRLRGVLMALFPQAGESFDRDSSTEREWYRELRICHRKHFPRYFQLGGNPGDVTIADINRLLTIGADVPTIQAEIKASVDGGRFENLVERLSAILDDVPQASLEPLITALFNLSDELPEIRNIGLLSSDGERLLVRMAIDLLRKITDRDARNAALRRCVLTSSATTGPVMCVSSLRPNKTEAIDRADLLVDLSLLKELETELVPRIRETARSGRIWKLRKLVYIIYRFSEWSSLDEVRTWLAEATKDQSLALTFFMEMLRESQVSGGRSRNIYTLLPVRLEHFVDLKILFSTIAPVATSELEKAAVEKLREAIELKQKEKPYTELYVMSRDQDGKLYYNRNDGF